MLLGVLLGVPTVPSYAGPALATLFDPAWVRENLPGGLPLLEARPARESPTPWLRWLKVACSSLASVIAAWIVLRRSSLVLLAALAVALSVAVGLGFDWLRSLLHDHGGEPERGLWLLVPFGVACAMVAGAQRLPRVMSQGRRRWLPTLAASTVLVTLLLLLPTAYYYGSRRAVVLAGVIALVLMLADYLLRSPRDRLVPTLALVFAAVVLSTFYQVRQLGPETAGAAAWALDAAVYARGTWLTLLLAKVVLGALMVLPRALARPLDAGFAIGLLATGLLVELTGVALPRMTYAVLFVLLVVGSSARQAWPSSWFAGGLLLLGHLYARHTAQLAGLELLLAGTSAALVAWKRMRLPARTSSVANGLTVAVALYLMFWPTVGFHLVNIDFAFMFQWVPAESYERAWWLIGGGVVLKLALPLLLVVALARDQLRDPLTASVACLTLAAKTTLLSVVIVSYAATHDMASQQALAMLAELVLLMFGVGTCVAAIPRREARLAPMAWQPVPGWANGR